MFDIDDIIELYVRRNPDGTYRLMWESFVDGKYTTSGMVPHAKIRIEVEALEPLSEV